MTTFYRHTLERGHRCDPAKPLTLGDREIITGRDLTQLDERTGLAFCVDCLADLPPGPDALAHVCGLPAGAARVGDVVWYGGHLRAFHGTYTITVIDPDGGLYLSDGFDRALRNVEPGACWRGD